MTLAFDKDIQKISNLTLLTLPEYLAFDFKIESEYLKEEQKVHAVDSWKPIEYRENKVLVQVEFFDPLLISQGQEKDKLELKIKNRAFFISTLGGLVDEDKVLSYSLPEQVPKGDRKVIQNIGETFQVFGLGISVGSALLSAIMGVSLKLFWKMLGAIQLMVHFPFFNISFPSNAKYLFSFVIDLANMKLVPTDWILEKLTGFKAQLNDGQMGLGGNFLSDLGLLLFAFLFLVLIIGIGVFLKLLCKGNKKVLGLIEKVRVKIFYNSFLRFLV